MTMRTRLHRLALALVLTAVLLNATVAGLSHASAEPSPVEVDIFTQKEPYGGRGAGKRSDAFGPDDSVVLYALVEYNDAPIDGIVVAFNVQVPSGAHFTMSARTDSSGFQGSPSIRSSWR